MDVPDGLMPETPPQLHPCPINHQADQDDTSLIPLGKQLLSHVHRKAFVSNGGVFIADSVSSRAAPVTRESGRKT